MGIVASWQNLEKNATQIMIFLSHYMWAENNTDTHSSKTVQKLQKKFLSITILVVEPFGRNWIALFA